MGTTRSAQTWIKQRCEKTGFIFQATKGSGNGPDKTGRGSWGTSRTPKKVKRMGAAMANPPRPAG
jgi:hypothetical protein